MKLVFGVGIGLVIGAILPYVFGKVSRPGPVVKELPSWSAKGGSTGAANNTAQNMAPAWLPPGSAAGTTGAGPQTGSTPAPAILAPQPPQANDTRPTALSDPAWLPPPPPNNDYRPPVANTKPLDNRADYRGLDRGTDSRNLQADNRNAAAAQYRNNDGRYDNRGTTAETSPLRRDTPAGGYSRDSRYDNAGSNYPPPAVPGSPLMPAGGQGPTSTYSGPQVSEPGVARFDGTIDTPPVRTSYDRAGSSNN
jgi:hypothetical protein